MCIVSFIPFNNKVLITHNRDEKSSRAKALFPKEYTVHGYTLLFPRDGDSGGTWIACNKNGDAAVLLNGAFEKHTQQPAYRKSRGLVFVDIFAASDTYLSYCNVDLTGIEPFTVVLWSNSTLYECRWDGSKKHVIKKDASAPYTWSSVTLYDEAIMLKRQTWFHNWLRLHPSPSIDEVIQFHLSAGDGDLHNSLRMNRSNTLLTVSITAMEIHENKSIMKYLDLQDDSITVHELVFTKAAVIPS
ncbi:MAG TPA: NRDE family protein [Chitinophagaceae bacterium]|nr:NRDE family protein [Chitinophagaceae bacterium]